jgi:hypothetical protein
MTAFFQTLSHSSCISHPISRCCITLVIQRRKMCNKMKSTLNRTLEFRAISWEHETRNRKPIVLRAADIQNPRTYALYTHMNCTFETVYTNSVENAEHVACMLYIRPVLYATLQAWTAHASTGNVLSEWNNNLTDERHKSLYRDVYRCLLFSRDTTQRTMQWSDGCIWDERLTPWLFPRSCLSEKQPVA